MMFVIPDRYFNLNKLQRLLLLRGFAVQIAFDNFTFQFDTMKPDAFTESAFKVFLANLCPRPDIYEIFTS